MHAEVAACDPHNPPQENMRKTLLLALALLVAVVLMGNTSASADFSGSASYSSSDGIGVVTVNANPGSLFRVYGPRAGGVYGLCALGVVGPSGTTSVVASWAPGFGSMYGAHITVVVTHITGSGTVYIDDPGHEWWFD